jgi:hypothetical protein
MNGENGGNRETVPKPIRGNMHFTCSGMDRTRLGFRKSTTFHHLTAIYQRSLLHLLWVPSQLPLVQDKPVLNKCIKTCFQGKEKFKKLIHKRKE